MQAQLPICSRCKSRPTANRQGVCTRCLPPSFASLSTRPTTALPKTEAKIAVMQARAARHEKVFHEDDAVFGDRLAARTIRNGNLDALLGVVIETHAGRVKVNDETLVEFSDD